MKITRRDVRNSHFYDAYDDSGNCLRTDMRGITTILGVLNKPGLVPWASRLAQNVIGTEIKKIVSGILNDGFDRNEIRSRLEPLLEIDGWEISKLEKEQAGRRGADIHDACETLALLYQRGQLTERSVQDLATEGEYTDEEYWLAAAFYNWLRTHRPTIISTERRLACVHCGYGCTTDLELDLGGRWIVDVKTSKGIYEEYGLQVVSQAHALINMNGHEHMTTPANINLGLLWLSAKASDGNDFSSPGAELVRVSNTTDQIEALFNVIGIYRWKGLKTLQRKEKTRGNIQMQIPFGPTKTRRS